MDVAKTQPKGWRGVKEEKLVASRLPQRRGAGSCPVAPRAAPCLAVREWGSEGHMQCPRGIRAWFSEWQGGGDSTVRGADDWPSGLGAPLATSG